MKVPSGRGRLSGVGPAGVLRCLPACHRSHCDLFTAHGASYRHDADAGVPRHGHGHKRASRWQARTDFHGPVSNPEAAR
jgi:hypothetical protein